MMLVQPRPRLRVRAVVPCGKSSGGWRRRRGTETRAEPQQVRRSPGSSGFMCGLVRRRNVMTPVWPVQDSRLHKGPVVLSTLYIPSAESNCEEKIILGLLFS